jgi:thiol-disulfide isomerase/thioredoxin
MLQRSASIQRPFILCSAFFLAAAFIVPAEAEAFQDAVKRSTDKPAKTTVKKSAEEPSVDDPFAVPEGSAKELLAFVNKIARMRPRLRSSQEVRDHLKKANAAIGQAVETILADKSADDATATAAVSARFSMLSMATRYDPTVTKTIEEFAKSLKSDSRPSVVAVVETQTLLIRVRGVATSSIARKKELINDVDQWLAKGKLDRSALQVAVPLARGLESPGKMELAVDAYKRFGARFKKSDDPYMALYGLKLEGAARRVQLPGNPIDVTGTTLAGEKFDWSQYKGKVVLVDFWATWCGPCIRELPNVKKNYELYHDRGFEVVGVSLDKTPERVEAFQKKHEITWTTLYGDAPNSVGWDHPLAVHYGITSIPTVILVDQAGKVVSLRARGPELGRLLEKLIGPPEVAGEGSDSKSTATDSKR